MNLTVRNVPDKIYKTLKEEARRNRRSLNAQILVILEAWAEETERRRRMRDLRGEMDLFAASLRPMPDSTPIIRRARGL